MLELVHQQRFGVVAVVYEDIEEESQIVQLGGKSVLNAGRETIMRGAVDVRVTYRQDRKSQCYRGHLSTSGHWHHFKYGLQNV